MVMRYYLPSYRPVHRPYKNAKRWLAARRVSNRMLAAELGVSDSMVSMVLNGFRPMPDRYRDLLVNRYGVPIEHLK